MGIYCTTTALEILLPGIKFDTKTSQLAVKCIDRGEREINKYICARYDVASFQTAGAVPPLVSDLCEQLGEGYIYQRQSRGGKESIKRGQEIVKAATKELMDIRDYKVDLVDSIGGKVNDKPAPKFQILSTTGDYTDTFAEDAPINWAIDSCKLDDIADDRDND